MDKIEHLNNIIVIGGGVAGISASLDLADQGYTVYLVEKNPSIGGKMAQLDKTFPTLDCSLCILSPKMVEASRHPNIKLLAYSEVKKVKKIDDSLFEVTILKKPRFVDAEKCNGCRTCTELCPSKRIPSEFDEKLGFRKAIYIPFPQAIPAVATIDAENCLHFTKNMCMVCKQNCPADAINYYQKPEEITVKAASIIVATGFELLDPSIIPQYGYGIYPDVLTSLQYERLINASGPTNGEIIRPSDGKKPKNIVFISCVGSRNENYKTYCSAICCMYLTKEAIVTKEHHPEINVTILYNDIRATGKNHDEFIRRATEEFGVKHVKGLPGSVLYDPPTGTYIVRYSDLTTSELNSLQADMIVLSPAVCPSKDSLKLSEILGIEVDKHGFFKAKNEITSIQTRVPGIYICGACQEPKDISSSVTQASGAAALAALRARSPRIKVTKIPTPSLIHKEEPRIGVFVCHCGWNIAAVIDSYEVAVYASKLPNVFHSEDLMFACSKDAQSKIKEAIEKYKLNRVVVAACTPRTHEPLFRKTCMEAGLNPYLFELVNIREHDSWVHSGKPEEATSKAKDLVRMAIARSSFLEPLEDYEVEVEPSAMVIGGGLAGITAALTIADKGFKVYLVEKDPKLGGRLHKEQYRIPFTEIDPTDYLEPLIENIKNHKNVEILTSSTIKEVCGSVGNFKVSLSSQGANKEIKVGTIILSVGAEELKPMKLYGYGEHKNVQTILEFRKMLKEVKSNERIAIILCAGARGKEGITYCGATCCSEAVDLALELKTLHPNTQIYALYRDIRVSFIGEEYYRKAREKGVVFIRYDETRMPAVNFRNDNVSIKVYDSILQNYIELDVDRIVLATPVAPSSTNQKIREILKVPLNMNGFFLEAHPKLRPVDFSNEGIYLCGSAYGAQSPVESVSQAFASASRALIPLTQGKVFSEGIISEVNPDICIGCGNCVAACQYGAISIEIKNHVAKVNPLLCKGCGVCAVECPARAIRMRHFTDQQITAMIKAALETITEEPKIIAFFCNWCAYAGADTAGVSRFQYPPTTRIIRVMCSGRVEQSYILEALRNGADGVLVGGCHPGTCHYVSGNVKAEQRIRALQTLLKSTGVEPQRVRLEWFSAGEGKRVADIMTSFSEEIKKLGPNPFRQLLLKHA